MRERLLNMSGFTVGRRGVPRRVWHLLRRVGGALWLLLQGAGLGLGCIVAAFIGLMLVMLAGQPDATLPVLAGDPGPSGFAHPQMVIAVSRAGFFVVGGVAFLAAHLLATAAQNWWAKIRGETVA